jgi:hypothetical protein
MAEPPRFRNGNELFDFYSAGAPFQPSFGWGGAFQRHHYLIKPNA